MSTAFLLLAQYGGGAVIPISLVCRDYFSHLTPEKLVRKISAGEIALPLVRIEASQTAAKGVHLVDLARWIDDWAEAARKECRQLCGAAYMEANRASGRADR
ncbi:pyocin activator PrtN family protein [Methylobacterium aquaticum]|uniref:pyocin activator PrtN family protein n=1 Tax=Methylobacterium aquaticum TaxID=270351 RepID=UPI003D1631BF